MCTNMKCWSLIKHQLIHNIIKNFIDNYDEIFSFKRSKLSEAGTQDVDSKIF